MGWTFRWRTEISKVSFEICYLWEVRRFSALWPLRLSLKKRSPIIDTVLGKCRRVWGAMWRPDDPWILKTVRKVCTGRPHEETYGSHSKSAWFNKQHVRNLHNILMLFSNATLTCKTAPKTHALVHTLSPSLNIRRKQNFRDREITLNALLLKYFLWLWFLWPGFNKLGVFWTEKPQWKSFSSCGFGGFR